MLNLMHEYGNAMHVYESACSKKKSKAEKLNRIALMEFTMPIKWIWTLLIEVMLRVN